MSTPTDEIQIDLDAVEDKTNVAGGKKEPQKDPVEVVRTDSTPTTEKIDDKTEEGLENLKKQLETEKSARIAAERRAQEASVGEAQAREVAQGTQLDLVKNAIETLTQAGDALEIKYAEAMAAQDYPATAKVQRQMSKNETQLVALESAKKQLESQPKPMPRPSLDAVEEYVGRIPGEYPRSRTWVREHPEYVRDAGKNRLMIAAHELALAKGLTADTDSYFESIEKTLDLRKPAPIDDPKLEEDPMKDAASKSTPRKPPPAAAPVTRSGNGAGPRPNVVTLTPQEVEMAEMNGMTPEEYARNKVALKREGRLQ
jgi:hypothetical protein